jgi:hypothetical protein
MYISIGPVPDRFLTGAAAMAGLREFP